LELTLISVVTGTCKTSVCRPALLVWLETQLPMIAVSMMVFFVLALWNDGLYSVYVHHVGCPELSLSNGMIEYGPSRAVGSTATHSCNDGYELSSLNNTRTCELRESSGWSGNDFVCNRKYLSIWH